MSIPEDSPVMDFRDRKEKNLTSRSLKQHGYPTILLVFTSVLGFAFILLMIAMPSAQRLAISDDTYVHWQAWSQNIHEAFQLVGHGGSRGFASSATSAIITNANSKPKKNSITYFNHTQAFQVLANNPGYSAHYFLLQEGLDAQENQAYCPVATSAAILNSFGDSLDLPVDPVYRPYKYATQNNLWNDCTSQKVIRHDEYADGIFRAPGGLGMLQTKALLECNLPEDWIVEMVPVEPEKISIHQMRQDLVAGLASSNSRVMINYHRKTAHQKGGGHWSPVGAYDETTDSFLIMDVAKYKYPPAWIPAELLYKSLGTIDSCGNWNFPLAQDNFLHDSSSRVHNKIITMQCFR
jgi:hypothetical protein